MFVYASGDVERPLAELGAAKTAVDPRSGAATRRGLVFTMPRSPGVLYGCVEKRGGKGGVYSFDLYWPFIP